MMKLKAVGIAGVAALLVSAVAGPASADNSAITPDTGKLTIHKYIGAPIGNAAEGTELNTADPTWAGAIAANGVVFDLLKVGMPESQTWPTNPPRGTYSKNASGQLEVRDSSGTLIGVYALTTAATAQVTTAGQGVAVTGDLPKGYYLVIENPAASTNITDATTGEPLFISQVAAPFVVAVPMTDPTGTGWLDMVHVYPKNEALSVDKTVDAKGSVAVGDEVHYAITVSVPGDIATSKKFDVFDVLDPSLDLVQNTVAVTTNPPLASPNDLVSPTDYTIAYDSQTRKLVVSFTASGRVKLGNASFVTVTFAASVNNKILNANNGTVSNIGHVDFTNQDGKTFDAESPDEPGNQIHTAAIKVTKVDQAGAALAGASFKVASSRNNAIDGNFIRQDPTTKVLYDYDPTSGSNWQTLGSANDYTISPTGSPATASFIGLVDRAGTSPSWNWKTYWVVETEAPAGYNLVGEPIEASFQSAYNAFAPNFDDYDYTYPMTVANSQSFTLPETGGRGTLLWTIGGIALLAGALLMLVTARKKNAAKSPSLSA